VLGGSAGLVACTSDAPAAPDDPVLQQGRDLYLSQCATCHGADGGGGLGPKLAGRMEERYPDIEDHMAVIRDGVSGTRMLPFGQSLTEEEIRAVARYEREVL
jgi:mono/diheme cytochrome c family protein